MTTRNRRSETARHPDDEKTRRLPRSHAAWFLLAGLLVVGCSGENLCEKAAIEAYATCNKDSEVQNASCMDACKTLTCQERCKRAGLKAMDGCDKQVDKAMTQCR